MIGLFGATVAMTGANEKTLKRLGRDDYEKVYLFPNSHAGYYPGARTVALKVIFRKSDGRLLGAQALGQDGVEKRVDALAMAIQMGATVYDLEEAELCYAPPFGSAKDPVNFAGMAPADVLRGDMPLTHWDSLDGAFLLDVRNPQEVAAEAVRGRGQHPAAAAALALWRSCRATARSRSSAAPRCAPTTRPASCCRTGSRPRTSPAACCRARCS